MTNNLINPIQVSPPPICPNNLLLQVPPNLGNACLRLTTRNPTPCPAIQSTLPHWSLLQGASSEPKNPNFHSPCSQPSSSASGGEIIPKCTLVSTPPPFHSFPLTIRRGTVCRTYFQPIFCSLWLVEGLTVCGYEVRYKDKNPH